MEIKREDHETYTTLAPQGDLDANSSIFLDEAIQELIQGDNSRIHVDCGSVPYISSAGLGVFISHLDEIKSRNGELIVSGPNPSVSDVFQLLGLDQLLTILKDRKEVDEHFGAV